MSLDGRDVPARLASNTAADLLTSLPCAHSEQGVVYGTGSLALAPGGPRACAWAIYRLSGFPDDHSFIPKALLVQHSGPAWLALCNYGRGTWRFVRLAGTQQERIELDEWATLVSPLGVFYAALIAYGQPATFATFAVEMGANTSPGAWPMFGRDPLHRSRSPYGTHSATKTLVSIGALLLRLLHQAR